MLKRKSVPRRQKTVGDAINGKELVYQLTALWEAVTMTGETLLKMTKSQLAIPAMLKALATEQRRLRQEVNLLKTAALRLHKRQQKAVRRRHAGLVKTNGKSFNPSNAMARRNG